MANWSPTEIALVTTAIAALITSAMTGVATLISALRTGKKVDGLLDARILAALAEGNLAGRADLHTEQTAGVAAEKALAHFDAEADAKSAATVRTSEAVAKPKT